MPFVSSVRGNFGNNSRRKSFENKYLITGGTITTAGGYRIHTFTTTGASTFDTSLWRGEISVEYLVIAGGAPGFTPGGGGGGAGGYRTGSLTLASGNTPVSVGVRGANQTTNGDDSILGPITSLGGGYQGAVGGSGGGSNHNPLTSGPRAGTPGQGHPGGTAGCYAAQGGGGSSAPSGGGGGAGTAGSICSYGAGGPGGSGLSSSISGTAVTRAGGGGGGGGHPAGGTGGTGGPGGGGNGDGPNGGPGQPAVGDNNGSGGGGGSWPGSGSTGGLGSPGVVIVRYLV